MCAPPSDTTTHPLPPSDERLIHQAERSLRALLNVEETATATDIDLALSGLQALHDRLDGVCAGRRDLLQQMQRFEGRIAGVRSRMHSLDESIIEAKMQRGELLTVRDCIARDLTRARRDVEEVRRAEDWMTEEGNMMEEEDDMPSEQGHVGRRKGQRNSMEREYDGKVVEKLKNEVLSSGNGGVGNTVMDGKRMVSTDELLVQDDVEVLARCTTEDLQKLQIAEVELRQVVDELAFIKKRHAELQRKVEAVREEW